MDTALLESIFQVKQQCEPKGIRGILQTSDYDTFIILNDTGTIVHEFKGAKKAHQCLPGDHVSWTNDVCLLELRNEHLPIVGTIELTNKSKYGLTNRGVPMYLFTPYAKRYPHFIVGCSEKDITRNMIGIIKFDRWSAAFPRGALQQLLGPSGDFIAEKQALIWQASPYKWPVYAYNPEQKEKTPTLRTRLDGYTFNIDPDGCKDVDDVFTFERIASNAWRVTISISDVASYIEDGSSVDIMASIIGQTLYDLNGCVIRPMIPTAYSETVCSLLPGKESYGVSLQFIWDGTTMSNPIWLETIFTVNQSYTYDSVDFPYKQQLAEISSYLAKKPVADPHKWVEMFMVYYNTEAGVLLKRAGMGILRKHDIPDLEKLERYMQYLPELKQLAFSSAEYCLAEEQDTLHYGLGAAAYAHASSPIRRYADLINQRILKRLIRGTTDYYIVPQAMYDMNQRGKAIKCFARDLTFLEAIATDHTVFQGQIVDKVKQDNGKMKIIIYIPLWKRMISTMYTYLSENRVLSRDEKYEIDVSDYKKITISCAFTPNARNWKERVIIHIDF